MTDINMPSTPAFTPNITVSYRVSGLTLVRDLHLEGVLFNTQEVATFMGEQATEQAAIFGKYLDMLQKAATPKPRKARTPKAKPVQTAAPAEGTAAPTAETPAAEAPSAEGAPRRGRRANGAEANA